LIGVEIGASLSLVLATRADFFIFLFAIPCMQVRSRFDTRWTAALVGLTTILTLLALMPSRGFLYALGMAVVYFGGTMLLVEYIGSTLRASLVEERQRALVAELQQANQRLEATSHKLQELAASRERQRLARELHDSVTQTIFSMTLTTQSALLLLDRDPRQLSQQLDRLSQLAQSTLSEMQTLITRLAPEDPAGGGFVATLREHLADRSRLDDLCVTLEAEGSQPLQPAEEAALFRIAQEGLNNIVKHACVSEAVLRLHLVEPFRMEIEDRGIGFDVRAAQGTGRLGLESMRERAAEIGWSLRVDSFPGNGTVIRVEKNGVEGSDHGNDGEHEDQSPDRG
jgi:signal transduction histidine kinase